jgi:hypothetical protein
VSGCVFIYLNMFYKYWIDGSDLLKIYVFFTNETKTGKHMRPYFLRMFKKISEDSEVLKAFDNDHQIMMQGMVSMPSLNVETKSLIKIVEIRNVPPLTPLNLSFNNLILKCGNELVDFVKSQTNPDPIYYFEVSGNQNRKKNLYSPEMCPAVELEKKLFEQEVIRAISNQEDDKLKRRMKIFESIRYNIKNYSNVSDSFIKIK